MAATKWGVVGAGKISNDFVAAMKSIGGNDHQILAVAARELKSAQDFSVKHSIGKAYGSYKELAEDPDIEVVYIGCVNIQHYPVGKLMLENGKHVLIEKPMTLSHEQTRALIETARVSKRFLMEALWSRCLPSYDCLMNLIQNGSIGEIVHVEACLGVPNLSNAPNFKRSLGSGTVLDLGIYPLNVVSMIYGEAPEKIKAVGHLNEDGLDIAMTCCLKYSGKRTANVSTNGMAELPNSITVIGTHGIIKVPSSMYVAKTIITPQKTFEYPLPQQSIPCNYPDSAGLKYEAMEVRKCLMKGLLESPLMPLNDSALLAKLMDNIRQQLGVIYSTENET